jgi:hypothetical protein
MSHDEQFWKRTILAVSAIVALFFTVTFGLTFFARDYIRGLAQEYVIDRSLPMADKGVEAIEHGLQLPLAQPFLGLAVVQEVVQVVRQEVADYRRDRKAYITRLVTGQRPVAPAVAIPDRARPIVEQLKEWKEAVRRYYDRTIAGLVRDLRIFSGSNLVAAILAGYLALRAQGPALRRLLVIAGVLLVSLAYGTLMYIDEFDYFRILFNSYIGWWYPVLLAGAYCDFYWEYGLGELGNSPLSQQPTTPTTP